MEEMDTNNKLASNLTIKTEEVNMEESTINHKFSKEIRISLDASEITNWKKRQLENEIQKKSVKKHKQSSVMDVTSENSLKSAKIAKEIQTSLDVSRVVGKLTLDVPETTTGCLYSLWFFKIDIVGEYNDF